jgi:tetratricopeptide (TPR) repeat protein
MKKTVFLLIFLPAIVLGQNPSTETVASQESLKKSAESLIAGFYKSWEDKQWDQIQSSIAPGGKYLTMTLTAPFSDVMRSNANYEKMNRVTNHFKMLSVSTELLGPTHATVNVRTLRTNVTGDATRTLEILAVFILELQDNNWKIKSYNPQVSYPLIFSENIDKQYQTGKIAIDSRFTGALDQMGYFIVYFLDDYKKKGITPARVGTDSGKVFATTWNPDEGFEGLAKEMINNIQQMSTYSEILERTGSSIKIRYEPMKSALNFLTVTESEWLEFWRNCMGEIVLSMGCELTIVDEGKYYVATVNAIPDWLPPGDRKLMDEAVARGDSAETYLIRGKFLARQNRTADALKAFEKVISLDPGKEAAFTESFRLNAQSGKFDEVTKLLDRWVELSPKSTQALFYKGMVDADMGKPEEALKAFEKLTVLSPDTAYAWVGKGQMLYELKRYDEALKAFNKALKLDPGRTDVQGMKSAALVRLNKFDDALKVCNLLQEGDPGYATATYNKACIYSLKGDKEKALAELRRALEMMPPFKAQARVDEDFKNLFQDGEFIRLTK